MSDVPPGARDEKFEEFLIAEHEQLSEAFLRNEEDGEKRVTFLITLAGGVGAVLAFLREQDSWLTHGSGNVVVGFALSALLVLGYVTYVRVVSRNATADGYLEGLSRVRQYFLDHTTTPRALEYLPFLPFPAGRRTPRAWKPWSIGKGGWLEMVVVINALLVFALVTFVLLVAARVGLTPSLVAGAVATGAAWRLLVGRANRLYERARAKDVANRIEAESAR